MGHLNRTIKGVIATPLKIIHNDKGNLYHILRSLDDGFQGFGEVYISTINYGEVKAWKKHTKMTSNIAVPMGQGRLVIFDDRLDSDTKGLMNEFILSLDNYKRITIPPGLWYGFSGLGKETNMLINVADIPHDDFEQTTKEIELINYKW